VNALVALAIRQTNDNVPNQPVRTSQTESLPLAAARIDASD
jgi:hypothetical protein